MFQTISEGRAVYKAELAAFKAWIEIKDPSDIYDRRKWSDEEWLPWHPYSEPHAWGSVDYEKVRDWNARLKGMQAVLGLTPTEIRDSYKAAGIPIK